MDLSEVPQEVKTRLRNHEREVGDIRIKLAKPNLSQEEKEKLEYRLGILSKLLLNSASVIQDAS